MVNQTRRAVPLLIAAIAVVGVAGVVLSDWSFDLARAVSNPWMWLIAAVFIVTETVGIDLPFKSQRHTYSMAEIPAVLGFFYLRPDELILACVAGSLVAYLLIRRQIVEKLTFNVSLQFTMVVTQLLIFEAIAISRQPTEATAMIGAYAAVTVTAVLSHVAVDQVITFVTRARSWLIFWRGLGLAVIIQLANGSLGLIAVLLIDLDWAAIFILLTPIVVLFGAYASLGKRISAEEKARISEKRVAALIQASSDVTTLMDASANLQYVSDAAKDVLGVDPSGVIGRHARELFFAPDEDVEALVAAVEEAAVAKDPVVLDVTSTHPSGEEQMLEVHLVNLLADEAVDAILMTVRDVTERRRLEERLTQAQKMDAVGQLAGGIAHDFNNLLAVIQNYAEFVKGDLPEDSGSIHDVEEILRATTTATSLTRQLLSFARSEFVQSRVVDVNELVARLHRLLARTIEESIELKTSFAPGLPNVKIDPGRLEQVLMNLAVNAKDAMPTGGRLVIRTYETTIAATLSEELMGGRYVVIEVEDTGVGIDPDVQTRVFEPFFTTKPKGQGTGLGLSTAYAIVKQFGGHIEVDSRLGAGTIFKIYLPATTEPASDKIELEPVPTAQAPCTVLVAEDAEPLLRLVVRVLAQNSYEVLAAESGVEAFELWQRHEGDIDLLVTDVVMPKMSGKELSKMTGLPTVFMSGYTDQMLSEEELPAGAVFLRKPFSSNELLASIATVLEGVAARS